MIDDGLRRQRLDAEVDQVISLAGLPELHHLDRARADVETHARPAHRACPGRDDALLSRMFTHILAAVTAANIRRAA
jgi:hypothetical protein